MRCVDFAVPSECAGAMLRARWRARPCLSSSVSTPLSSSCCCSDSRCFAPTSVCGCSGGHPGCRGGERKLRGLVNGYLVLVDVARQLTESERAVLQLTMNEVRTRAGGAWLMSRLGVGARGPRLQAVGVQTDPAARARAPRATAADRAAPAWRSAPAASSASGGRLRARAARRAA